MQAQEPRAYIVHTPEDEIYGTGPDRLQFHPLAQYDLDNGYRQTPLYTRPAEQEVTEAARALLTQWDAFEASCGNQEEAYYKLAKYARPHWNALKAAMEAGR